MLNWWNAPSKLLHYFKFCEQYSTLACNIEMDWIHCACANVRLAWQCANICVSCVALQCLHAGSNYRCGHSALNLTSSRAWQVSWLCTSCGWRMQGLRAKRNPRGGHEKIFSCVPHGAFLLLCSITKGLRKPSVLETLVFFKPWFISTFPPRNLVVLILLARARKPSICSILEGLALQQTKHACERVVFTLLEAVVTSAEVSDACDFFARERHTGTALGTMAHTHGYDHMTMMTWHCHEVFNKSGNSGGWLFLFVLICRFCTVTFWVCNFGGNNNLTLATMLLYEWTMHHRQRKLQGCMYMHTHMLNFLHAKWYIHVCVHVYIYICISEGTACAGTCIGTYMCVYTYALHL